MGEAYLVRRGYTNSGNRSAGGIITLDSITSSDAKFEITGLEFKPKQILIAPIECPINTKYQFRALNWKDTGEYTLYYYNNSSSYQWSVDDETKDDHTVNVSVTEEGFSISIKVYSTSTARGNFCWTAFEEYQD